jgi:hypothetical protein
VAEAPKSTSAPKGVADLQKRVDKEQEQGYVGNVPDGPPNSAYSLESGPDSPPVVEDDRTAVVQQHVRDAKAASK